MKRVVLSLIACTLAVCSTAGAVPLDYSSQNRFVKVTGSFIVGSPVSQQTDASGFADFNETLDKTFNTDLGDPFGLASAHGTASQLSSLLGSAITADGSATGFTGEPFGSSAGGGESQFTVSFHTSQPLNYALDFDLTADFGSYSFTGPSLSFAEPNAGSFVPASVHDSGLLAPGDYTFDIHILGSAPSEGSLSTFGLDFAVAPTPEPSSVAPLLIGCGGLLRCRKRG